MNLFRYYYTGIHRKCEEENTGKHEKNEQKGVLYGFSVSYVTLFPGWTFVQGRDLSTAFPAFPACFFSKDVV